MHPPRLLLDVYAGHPPCVGRRREGRRSLCSRLGFEQPQIGHSLRGQFADDPRLAGERQLLRLERAAVVEHRLSALDPVLDAVLIQTLATVGPVRS